MCKCQFENSRDHHWCGGLTVTIEASRGSGMFNTLVLTNGHVARGTWLHGFHASMNSTCTIIFDHTFEFWTRGVYDRHRLSATLGTLLLNIVWDWHDGHCAGNWRAGTWPGQPRSYFTCHMLLIVFEWPEEAATLTSNLRVIRDTLSYHT